jgi:hypothetical protein
LAIIFFFRTVIAKFLLKLKNTFAALSVAVGADALFGVSIKCREYREHPGFVNG